MIAVSLSRALRWCTLSFLAGIAFGPKAWDLIAALGTAALRRLEGA